MSDVVLRCPNCGTTRPSPGECEACHEAEARYFCPNHTPGRWLDAPACTACGARFGARARATPLPPGPSTPPPRRDAPRPTPTPTPTPPRTPPPSRRGPAYDLPAEPTYGSTYDARDDIPPPPRRAPRRERAEPELGPEYEIEPPRPRPEDVVVGPWGRAGGALPPWVRVTRWPGARGLPTDVGVPSVGGGVRAFVGCAARLVMTLVVMAVLASLAFFGYCGAY